MKRIAAVCSIAISCFMYSSIATAYVFVQNEKIASLTQFETGIGRDYTLLTFTNNATRCRIPHDNKELYSFALALYMSGKTASFVCSGLEDDPGGSSFPSRKVHRIITN
ncbi:MAG: hypothetical protein GY928_29545 [Colwellia sp.]|nr:hypothetical protein [Colwellia sp.]